MNSALEKFYWGKTVAVTGATGYIGTAIIDRLIKLNANPVAIIRGKDGISENIKVISGDIDSYTLWEEIVNAADTIFHLAGNTSIASAQNNSLQSLHSTIKPINHLTKAINLQKKKIRIVYASTATVYGLNKNLPISEDEDPSPITYYDLHKFFAEQELVMCNRLDENCESVILRLGNVYGFGNMCSVSSDRGVLNKIARNAVNGEEIAIYGDGNSVRDYIHLEDVVDAFLYSGFSNNIQGECFNISNGVGIKLNEAFKKIQIEAERLCGKRSNILYKNWPKNTSPIELRDYYANIDKFTRKTGWNPNIGFDDGIKKMISEILDQKMIGFGKHAT